MNISALSGAATGLSDVSVGPARPLPASSNHGSSLPSVTTGAASHAHDSSASRAMSSLIDRVRQDYQRNTWNIDRGIMVGPAGAGRSSIDLMVQTTNQAMKLQNDMTRNFTTAQFGLTFAQQSQSGVKSLIEKS